MSGIPKMFAREYALTVDGHTILITRYDNHRNIIPDGRWVVCWVRGGLNPWYLNADGIWKYKHGCNYATAEEAYEHCLQFPPAVSSKEVIQKVEALDCGSALQPLTIFSLKP